MFVVIMICAIQAPAPEPRPIKMPGVWEMTWNGDRYIVRLAEGGKYTAEGNGTVWAGSWKHVDGRLSVREHLKGHPRLTSSWRIDMISRGRRLEGTTRQGVVVHLTRLKE